MGKKIISVEISDELRDAIRAEAFRLDKSFSATIRAVLEEKFNIVEKEEKTK